MRAPVLIGIVVSLHLFAVGAIIFMQGCGTKGPIVVEPPPAPVMPPKQDPMTQPRPVFQPPVPVEAAPSMIEPAGNKIYQVQKGDSLSRIASRVGVSAREIMELNKIKNANHIRIGQKLILPDYASVSAMSAPAPKPVTHREAPKAAPKAAREVVGAGSTYVVQPGDSLSKIAVRHGVSVTALRDTNKLKGEKILVGQKLVIPGGKTAEKKTVKPAAPAAAPAAPAVAPEAPVAVEAPAVPAMTEPAPAPAEQPAAAPQPVLSSQDQPLDYTVQDGDTVENIAKLFIVRKEDIMRLNNLGPTDIVKPGQKIKIPPSSP